MENSLVNDILWNLWIKGVIDVQMNWMCFLLIDSCLFVQAYPTVSLFNCKIIQLHSYPIASISKKLWNEYPHYGMFIII